MWYELTMSRCKGKSASYTLTAVTNGLIRPWEVRKGGTSAYDGTPLEPVIDALKSYGTNVLGMPPQKAVRTLNMKFNNCKRIQKRLFEVHGMGNVAFPHDIGMTFDKSIGFSSKDEM